MGVNQVTRLEPGPLGAKAMDSETSLFEPLVPYDLPGQQLSELAVADLRGNGIEDVLELADMAQRSC